VSTSVLAKGINFTVPSTGEFEAEFNATLVLLVRLFNEEIKLWMSPQQVKTILLKRLLLPDQASRHVSAVEGKRQTESELT
jgi:hypothetical protein